MPVISLPRSSLVFMDNEIIEIDIPEKFFKKINMNNIEKARGLLKSRNIDPIKFQREIRKEWD